MKKKLLTLTLATLVSMAFCLSAFSDNPTKTEYDDNRQQAGGGPFVGFSVWSRVSTDGVYLIYYLTEDNSILDIAIEYLDSSVQIPVIPGRRIKIQLITPFDYGEWGDDCSHRHKQEYDNISPEI